MAEFRIAAHALFEARAAMMFVTAFTACDALATEIAIAAGAVEVAFAAHCRSTLLTAPPLIIADGRSAIGALDAMPVGQRDKWTAGVVSPQQVGDDHEEVQ